MISNLDFHFILNTVAWWDFCFYSESFENKCLWDTDPGDFTRSIYAWARSLNSEWSRWGLNHFKFQRGWDQIISSFIPWSHFDIDRSSFFSLLTVSFIYSSWRDMSYEFFFLCKVNSLEGVFKCVFDASLHDFIRSWFQCLLFRIL